MVFFYFKLSIYLSSSKPVNKLWIKFYQHSVYTFYLFQILDFCKFFSDMERLKQAVHRLYRYIVFVHKLKISRRTKHDNSISSTVSFTNIFIAILRQMEHCLRKHRIDSPDCHSQSPGSPLFKNTSLTLHRVLSKEHMLIKRLSSDVWQRPLGRQKESSRIATLLLFSCFQTFVSAQPLMKTNCRCALIDNPITFSVRLIFFKMDPFLFNWMIVPLFPLTHIVSPSHIISIAMDVHRKDSLWC